MGDMFYVIIISYRLRKVVEAPMRDSWIIPLVPTGTLGENEKSTE
jgi:hypothetical protein